MLSKNHCTALFRVALLSLCLISLRLLAQTPTGSMRGMVQDSSGARLAHAKVVARARGAAFERQVTADDHGEFRLLDLLPGDYRLTVSAHGFAEAHADVELIVSSVRDYTITMKPAGSQETVKVESQAASVTTQSIDLASAVHQKIGRAHV